MIGLILLLSLINLLVVGFVALKLIEIEYQMNMAKVHNDVTQRIPVRKRRKF